MNGSMVLLTCTERTASPSQVGRRSESAMYIYYCWVTALLPSYQDGIVAGMARRGYMIGPAAKDGKVVSPTHEGSPAFLFALSVYQQTETNVGKIYEDLLAVLQEMKTHYFSVIVSLSTEAT